MTSDNHLERRYLALRQELQQLCQEKGRPAVRLVAVSKYQPFPAIETLWALGQRDFAESRLQEALPKIAALPQACWHFIGTVQRNKGSAIARHFNWVQSVTDIRTAEVLSAQRSPHQVPLQVLIQVKLSGEPTKQGAAPEHVPALAQQVATLPNLQLRGLMTMGRRHGDNAPLFLQLHAIRERLLDAGLALDTLSMGMSGDYRQAITAGATMVRIGTALFGSRETHLTHDIAP
jgi:pyridoxal phosphate enzyme (YggS family)